MPFVQLRRLLLYCLFMRLENHISGIKHIPFSPLIKWTRRESLLGGVYMEIRQSNVKDVLEPL